MSTTPDPTARVAQPDPAPADVDRPLPASLESEKALLSSMLLDPAEVCPMVEDLPPAALFLFSHQTVFQLLLDRWRSGEPLDVILLTVALREVGELDAVGGPAFVTELFSYVPTAANARYYLEEVRRCAAARRAIAAGPETALAYEPGANPEEVAERLEIAAKEIRDLAVSDVAPGPSHKDRVMAAINGIEAIYERRGAPAGIPTGFSRLDQLTGGLSAPDVFVIAARPSMGKTALGMNIAEHAALAGRRTAVFSLEMGAEQLLQRMICSRARVNLQKLRDGFLAERDFPTMSAAATKIAEAPLEIDDGAGLSIMELRARARRVAKRLGGLDLIVIDYLQLLRCPSRRGQENRQIEISEVSGGIKALAKELAVPIVVLAQLNRNPEGRTGSARGRPRLSDLRESGSIEQDADVVGLLVREEYYADGEEERAKVRGKATLIIAKQRNGPTDDVPLTFLKEYTRFEDRAEQSALDDDGG